MKTKTKMKKESKELETEIEVENTVENEVENIEPQNIEPEKIVNEQSELDSILSQYNKPFESVEKENENESTETNETETGVKKETRGRKKGGKNKTTSTNDTESLPVNNLLNGSILIIIIDLVLPLIIMYVGKIVTKKTVPLDALQLTEKQKKDLIPICDEVAKRINVNNPILLLTVTLSGIYGMNYMAYLQLNK